jgi:DNA-binding CsgD family transcriptional regulator
VSQISPLLCPLLVGRDDLLDLADRRLTAATNGSVHMLLLAGEAGIGKTRLLTAIRRKAAAQGFEVVRGDIAPQDRHVPASSLLDMARSMVSSPRFANLGRDLLDMSLDAERDEPRTRRTVLLEIVDRIVSELDAPALLAFEDLQWADDLSLEILTELARRIQDRPVLLLAAYRTDDLGPGSMLREWRARLLTQRLAEEARLAPLTLEQTGLMTTLILATGLPAPREVVAAVHERTDGIPLHVEELLGALGPEARGDGRAIREATVPATIEDAVLARFERLSPASREVAQAGAVIGRCFVPEVLAGIMDLRPEELDAPLVELVDQAFLDPPGPRSLYDFRHQLLRDALYRSVSPTALRRLHARAAEFGAALEGASEIHASLHYERAGLRDEAHRAALSGAHSAARLASHREAVELYRRAVDNMPADLAPIDEAELLEAYANEAAAIELHDIAEKASRRARDCYIAAGRPLEAARQLAMFVGVARREARPMASRLAQIDEALGEIESLPQDRDWRETFVVLQLERAYAEIDGLELDAAAVAIDAAIVTARASDDTIGLLYADAVGGTVDVLRGSVDAGLARMTNAARQAREAGNEDVAVTSYRNTVTAAMHVMAYDVAKHALAEGLLYADSIEQTHCRHVMSASKALVGWADGRWDEALAIAEQEAAEGGCRRGEITGQTAIGFIAFGRGEFDRARAVLGAARASGERSGVFEHILPPMWGLAEADLAAGAPGAAFDTCVSALGLASSRGEHSLLAPFAVTGVRAALAAGRPEEADRWLAQIEPILGDDDRPSAALAHARGLSLLAAGSSALARRELHAAIQAWDRIGRIWEATWARLDLASCDLRSSRFAEAASLLSEARTIASRLESRPLQARIDELARIARGRGTVTESWHPLTSREFEVARLIASGMTNAAIAAELSIAPKTASAHVEHILAKLGVSRRAEIGAWVATVSRAPTAAVEPRVALAQS